MTPSNVIEQILACLPNAQYRSAIYVFTGEQEETWGVVVEDEKRGYVWSGLSEDPTSTLQEYITANPEQQLRIVTFKPIQRFP